MSHWRLLTIFLIMIRGLCILLIVVASDALAQRKLLCIQEEVSVYYNVFSKGLEGDREKWQVDLEIMNNAKYDLYYRTRAELNPLASSMGSPVTDKQSLIKVVSTLIPPYLRVTVLNEIADGEVPFHYVHGKSTLIPTTDTTRIQKVDQSRHLQSFEVWLKKDNYPIVEGQFLELLQSLEVVKARKRKEREE